MGLPFDLQPGVEPFPGYCLHLPLGRGGCGEVWEAHTQQGPVALKFMRVRNAAAATREIRGTEAIRKLRHPNLLRIEQVFSLSGYVVIAMELADGSLADVFDLYQQDGTSMPPYRVCEYLSQAADAIDFLNSPRHRHDGRLVAFQHADIKPSNILLCGETVKLADFGLSSPMTYGLELHGRRGTLDFAAPEIFRGQLSERTDQYALAVTYCVLRSGRVPFSNLPNRFTPSYTRGHPDLGMLTTPERSIIARALSVSPVHRWPCCREMIDLLGAVVENSLTGSQLDGSVFA